MFSAGNNLNNRPLIPCRLFQTNKSAGARVFSHSSLSISFTSATQCLCKLSLSAYLKVSSQFLANHQKRVSPGLMLGAPPRANCCCCCRRRHHYHYCCHCLLLSLFLSCVLSEPWELLTPMGPANYLSQLSQSPRAGLQLLKIIEN